MSEVVKWVYSFAEAAEAEAGSRCDWEAVRGLLGYRLDCVSCSPFRVPVARLAAAHAALGAGA
jgi:phosphoenolpyruvate synthase/pyruvate phosphate dikinase